MLEQQEQHRGKGTTSVKFLSRLSRGGGKILINVPLDMHEKIKQFKDKPISVTIKEVVLD